MRLWVKWAQKLAPLVTKVGVRGSHGWHLPWRAFRGLRKVRKPLNLLWSRGYAAKVVGAERRCGSSTRNDPPTQARASLSREVKGHL